LFNCFFGTNELRLLVQKVTKKDTTPKDTAILLSHSSDDYVSELELTTLIAMQIPIAIGIVSAPGVDYPRTFGEDFYQQNDENLLQ
jgi:hypothetical protein